MNVCVLGLWHLGTVTAACLASAGHDVIGLDFDARAVEALATGKPPIFEPGLEELIGRGAGDGRLRFTSDPADALAAADLLWVAYDTPVDDHDRADVDFVVERVVGVLPHLRDGAQVLISSQVPAGTTARLETVFASGARGRRVDFAYSPENLRLGQALAAFTAPDRIIMGVRPGADRGRLEGLISPFTERIEWMSVESAEMTKHALNAFLATSVTFINEVAALCEQVGADAGEVARGLKSEPRIGPRAYLSPGGAFAGGTLARDIVFLSELGQREHVPLSLLPSVKTSNDAHREWPQRRLEQLLGTMAARTIGVWGLTYKVGTDTLRRSSAVELCRWLVAQGASVRAHDPVVKSVPDDIVPELALVREPLEAAIGASALVVATPWPDYRAVDSGSVAAAMARPLVLDAARFLGHTLGADSRLEYYSVGVRSR
jgi:UDPglucose 6-dehydrogenase